MQQLTGKIISIVPTEGYQSQGGWIYTFDITIQGPNAQVTGEIGSKTTPYPLAVGQEISVTADQTDHGVKFKKFNPGYQGGQGGGSGGGQRGGGKSPELEERIIRGNALNAVMSSANIMPDEIENYLMAGVNFIKSGVWGLSQQDSFDPTPRQEEGGPVDDGSDIPF